MGGFSSLTPSGTSVLLQGELTKTPEGTKQARPHSTSCDLRCNPLVPVRNMVNLCHRHQRTGSFHDEVAWPTCNEDKRMPHR